MNQNAKAISKTRYISFKRCPSYVWLLLNKKEEYVKGALEDQNTENGKQVGGAAKDYFPNTVDATALKADGTLDIERMIDATKAYISGNAETIAEASFSVNGLFCSVDLLHKVDDGYEIYEVKASTKAKKEHLYDAAFQKYVLQKAGLNIVNVYILHLNTGYVRHGDLDLKELFTAKKVDDEKVFLDATAIIEKDLATLTTLLSSKVEPSPVFSSECKDCPFEAYCKKDVPHPCVLDLQGSPALKIYDLYNRGVVSVEDVLKSGQMLNRFQKNQIDSYLNNKELIIGKDEVKSFLNTIRYPIYHFDFETIEVIIPPSDGTRPYQVIPTQYSLHIEYEDERIEHKEFLGSTIDPRREIAESVCENIPFDSCVLAFNKSYECRVLRDLANTFDDLRDHLNNVADNLLDLADPFSKGHFYHKDMKNKYSIKAVLPALCPNDPELDYSKLPVVHKGDQAMMMYPKMLEMEPDEKERVREGLLKYCCLDTFAMVKILRKLREHV